MAIISNDAKNLPSQPAVTKKQKAEENKENADCFSSSSASQEKQGGRGKTQKLITLHLVRR